MKNIHSIYDIQNTKNIHAEQTGFSEQRKVHAKKNASVSFGEKINTKTNTVSSAAVVRPSGYEKDEVTGKNTSGKSAIEETEEKFKQERSASERRKQMSVLANTMTAEDYRKMQDEGISAHSADSEKIVTVVDKIKAQLAKAGVDVSCMGDGLTKEQLEAITGSAAMANQLAQAFSAANLPLTEENISDGMQIMEQAKNLQPISDGAINYLISNHLQPTVENLYLAEHCGGETKTTPKKAIDFEPLKKQMEQVITEAGEEANKHTFANGVWLIENDIAFTAENFSYMQKLRGLELPLEEGQTAEAIALAVAEGNRPKDALLLPEFSLEAQAVSAEKTVAEAEEADLSYLASHQRELTIQNLRYAQNVRSQGKIEDTQPQPSVTARRILEETRLLMTAEANLSLLKKGISIDTKPLEELVAKLKEQEQSEYILLSENSGEAQEIKEQAALFAETDRKVLELKQAPAYILGSEEKIDTLNELHRAGKILQETFEKANRSYETLMTAPRADLGDSIQKAFAGTDDILAALGMEQTAENEKAVRILGYNRLEITEESILKMKAADEQVQRTFALLKPHTVREMIAKGINPLDLPLDELNRTAEKISAEQEENTAERFSEYLWKLDKKQELSKEERQTFIGVYRLLHQVEKSDGAAVGALLHQGAEITMRNLLTAVRSAKKGSMDYTADDSFGGAEATEKGTSITAQIEAAYQNNCAKDAAQMITPKTAEKLLQIKDWENMTPEQVKQTLQQAAEEMQTEENRQNYEYANERLAEIGQAAAEDENVYRLLSGLRLPNTPDYALAAGRLMQKRNQVFSQLFNSENVFSGEKIDFAAIQEEILERFAEALETPKEMAAAQEALAETAENVMKTMIAEDENITSMDIRELKLMHTELSVAGKLAEEENYTIPVLVGNKVTNVSLKIVRGAKQKGMVEIMFETERAGKITAAIQAGEKKLNALIASEKEETKEFFEKNAEEFEEIWDGEEAEISFVRAEAIDFSHFAEAHKKRTENEQGENSEYEIQTARLYKIAKSFLETVKKLDF